jgi:hypothetical protein
MEREFVTSAKIALFRNTITEKTRKRDVELRATPALFKECAEALWEPHKGRRVIRWAGITIRRDNNGFDDLSEWAGLPRRQYPPLTPGAQSLFCYILGTH